MFVTNVYRVYFRSYMCLYLKYGTEPSCKHLNKSIYVSSGQDMYHMYINSNILIYEFKDKLVLVPCTGWEWMN